MRRLMSWLDSQSRRLLVPGLVIPNVVALPAIDWLGRRPTPWNWASLALVGTYLVLTTVVLQREWNKGKTRKRPSPGRHASPGN